MSTNHRHAPPAEMNEAGQRANAPSLSITTTNSADFHRRFHDLQARLWKREFKLKRSAGGALLILRWDQCRVIPDLEGVEAFARKVGA